jgi:hypothetical protein
MFASLAAGDDQMGHVMSDIGMSGVFNAGPIEIGGRFQLGSLLGVDPYKGFDAKNLVGPIGNMVDNVVKAVQSASTGDIPNAMEKVMPSGMRGLFRMATESGDFRDAQGRLILEPSKLEQVATAAGFRPKALNQYFEQQALKLKSDEIAQRARQSLYNDLADKLLAGNTAAVRMGLMEEARSEMEAGNVFDPKEGLSRVVELAQARSVPETRTGMKGNQANEVAIGKMYEQRNPPRSEAELYMQRKQAEREVGIPGAGRVEPAKLRESQFIDQLMAQNPRMTTAEARMLFQRTMSKQGQRLGALLQSQP